MNNCEEKFGISLLICVLGIISAGCSQENKVKENVNYAETQQDFIEIVDQNNMTAKVPKDISRVILTAIPLPSIYAITRAPIENLVGMHPGSATAIENSVMKSMYPELINVPTNFVDGMDINIEEMLKLDPDVVIYWADYKNQYDVMTEAGIPAIGVTTQAKGNALKTMESWLKIMGKTFGTDTENGNATKALEYGAQVQEEIAEVVNKIPQEDKPKVLYLYGHSEDEIRVSGKDFYGGFWIESSG